MLLVRLTKGGRFKNHKSGWVDFVLRLLGWKEVLVLSTRELNGGGFKQLRIALRLNLGRMLERRWKLIFFLYKSLEWMSIFDDESTSLGN